jgi:F0F1-type ATP synthase membrane subunit c/vacuolar-type H+-ATPase subunit K
MTITLFEKVNLRPRYRSTAIIVLSFVGSILAYTLVAYMLTQSSSLSYTGPNVEIIQQALYGTAVVLAFGVIILRRVWLNTSRLTRIVEEHGLKRLVDELVLRTIILAAFSEAIAVFGLVLSLLTKSFDPMWRLGTIGVVLLLYNLPRRSAWEQTVENFSRIAYEEQ